MKPPPAPARIRGQCHRCDPNGFAWLDESGHVVAFDDPTAIGSVRCTHDNRMRRVRWVTDDLETDARIRPGPGDRRFDGGRP